MIFIFWTNHRNSHLRHFRKCIQILHVLVLVQDASSQHRRPKWDLHTIAAQGLRNIVDQFGSFGIHMYEALPKFPFWIAYGHLNTCRCWEVVEFIIIINMCVRVFFYFCFTKIRTSQFFEELRLVIYFCF